MEEKEKQVEKSKPDMPPLLSAHLYQPSPSLPPAGMTSTSHSTRAPPLSPPPEISTDLAAVAMVMAMAVGTTCCWVSEEARASEGELG